MSYPMTSKLKQHAEKENEMFGKTKGPDDNDRVPAPVQQFQRLAVAQSSSPDAADTVSSIGADVTIVGKLTGEGTVKVFGRIEGELRAATVIISDGAQVEGDLVADDVTIGGRVKGTIHADRVKLASTAVVQGDIFHRSLAIEENARFEGSSRREDSATEIPLRGQAVRPAPVVAAHEANGKLNSDKDGHAGTAA
jgi:cytoskeletal protein CcmA (bactofilin family)